MSSMALSVSQKPHIATIGQVARRTGGEVYKYTYFQVSHLASFPLINCIINPQILTNELKEGNSCLLNIFFYSQADIDGERLITNLINDINRPGT